MPNYSNKSEIGEYKYCLTIPLNLQLEFINTGKLFQQKTKCEFINTAYPSNIDWEFYKHCLTIPSNLEWDFISITNHSNKS